MKHARAYTECSRNASNLQSQNTFKENTDNDRGTEETFACVMPNVT